VGFLSPDGCIVEGEGVAPATYLDGADIVPLLRQALAAYARALLRQDRIFSATCFAHSTITARPIGQQPLPKPWPSILHSWERS